MTREQGEKEDRREQGFDGFWRGKRVFVTGHTGFKGAWLAKILESMAAEAFGFALAPPTKPNLYDVCAPAIHSTIGDVRDFDALAAAYRAATPDIVFHMAAQPLVLTGYQQPRETFDVNVMGTVNLLECVRRFGAASVVIVTTDKVYRNTERRAGYREEEPLDGYDPYANSKSCAELVTAGYRRSFFEGGAVVSTARSGNVIGGGDFAANRLIPDCARAAAAGARAVIRNPRSVRPYQHVLDTLFAYLLIARRQYEQPALAAAYNIGPDENGCVESGVLADLFCAAWGSSAGWIHQPAEQPHESALLLLDCAKIERVFGWRPRWDIAKAVQAAAEWYRAYYDGADAAAVLSDQIRAFMGMER